LFPTHGGNYGHVIAELLSVGTPVLLSDQTPWRDLTIDGLGRDLALENMDGFVKVIKLISLKNINKDQKVKAEIR
jgi:glycosyltransferase involved in cell wall biosynthesis